ncbi:hypothetical protein ACYZT4_02630 [Pseudomonas sp. GB2N2]
MDVNDNAGCLNERVARAFFVGTSPGAISYRGWRQPEDVHDQISEARPLDAPVGPEAAEFLMLI